MQPGRKCRPDSLKRLQNDEVKVKGNVSAHFVRVDALPCCILLHLRNMQSYKTHNALFVPGTMGSLDKTQG